MRRFRLCSALLLLAWLLSSSPLPAETLPAETLPAETRPAETAPSSDDRETRLLALIEELATLLDSLPPERREAVRRLLDERLAELAAEPEPAADLERPAEDRVAETPPAPASPPSESVEQPPTVPAPSDAASAPRPATVSPPAETPATSTAIIRPPSPTTSRTTTTTPPPSRPIETTPRQPPPAQIDAEPAESTNAPAEPISPPPGPTLRCELAVPLDTDQDRRLTAFDRYWRHLYLWTDVDGDGDLDERETESPYERGIRSVELGLHSFVRGKGKRKRTLDITIEERVIFDVGGDGYGGPVPRRDDGALVIDASAVRADGGPDLRGEDGEPLVGLQALRPGQRWGLPDGSTLVPRCR